MSRQKTNRFKRNAELALAQEQNPEARTQAKRDGIAVGKRVRYTGETGDERWGVVRSLSRSVVRSKYVDSAVVQLTGAGLMKNGENIIVREDEIALSDIREVLEDGRIAEPESKPGRSLPVAPRRDEGYEFCGIRNCEEKPIIAVVMRKFDREVMDLGEQNLIAMCRKHYEPYRKNDDKPAIPLHWQFGVEGETYRIPVAEVESVSPTVDAKSKSVSPVPIKTDSPYEGKRGRHPLDCACSKHVEH